MLRNFNLILAVIFVAINLCAQTEDTEKLRKELISELDSRLEKLRQEMVSEIDRRLAPPKQMGFLGVTLSPINQSLRTLLDISPEEGVLVSKVTPGSPAEQAGIKDLDIILSFNGQKVNDVEKLQNIVMQTVPGTNVKLQILQKREQKEISVTLGATTVQEKKTSKNALGEFLEKQGVQKDSLKEMEKQFKELFGQNAPDMGNFQKQIQKQLEALQKDPELQENLQKLMEELGGGGQNLERLLEKFLPKPEKNKSEKTVENEHKDKEQDEIDSLLDDLLDEKETKNEKPQKNTYSNAKSYFGISLMAIPESLKENEGFTENHGILIAEVAAGSPADKAGIKKWEILLAIGDKKVASVDEALQILSSAVPGEKIVFSIFTAGETRKVTVLAGQKPQ